MKKRDLIHEICKACLVFLNENVADDESKQLNSITMMSLAKDGTLSDLVDIIKYINESGLGEEPNNIIPFPGPEQRL